MFYFKVPTQYIELNNVEHFNCLFLLNEPPCHEYKNLIFGIQKVLFSSFSAQATSQYMQQDRVPTHGPTLEVPGPQFTRPQQVLHNSQEPRSITNLLSTRNKTSIVCGIGSLQRLCYLIKRSDSEEGSFWNSKTLALARIQLFYLQVILYYSCSLTKHPS